MAIIPSVIEKKVFRRGFMGYLPEDVDEFLDEIILGYERLHKENVLLKNKNAALAESSLASQHEIKELAKSLRKYSSLENAIHNALVRSEKTGEEIQRSAIEKADLIEADARKKAKEIIAFAELEKKMLISEASIVN